MIGKPGTGKSHIAKAVAYQATLQGHNVCYLEADSAFRQYALGDAVEQRLQMRRLLEADLLVLDGLFLARRISDAGGELLQSLVYQRYKLRRSIVVTSNRVVQDWGKYLGDNTMATTLLDRLMHRAQLLKFEGKATGSKRQPAGWRSKARRPLPRNEHSPGEATMAKTTAQRRAE